MPWRGDFVQSFWLDPDFVGFAGLPDENNPLPAPPSPEELSRLDMGLTRNPVHRAIITIRDRIGFEYQREIGLDDFVSVRDAASLLEIPVMTVNRWVRAKRVKSAKQHGFAVIPLREVLRIAEEQPGKLKRKIRGQLVIMRG